MSFLGSVMTSLFGSDYVTPERASSEVYGYDVNGNLMSKGTYQYNSGTGKYELKAGELTPADKKIRQLVSNNINRLVATAGSTPDAFVSYAKELATNYQKQGERYLDEQYTKQQQQLNENLAKRGLSSSRAATDLTAELQGKKFTSLQNLFDEASRYGYDVQSSMQQQALSSLGTLAGYQGQLSSADQGYLNQALQTAQLGQQYENQAAQIKNQNIAKDNAVWQSLGDDITTAATLAAGAFAFPAAGMGATAGMGSMLENYLKNTDVGGNQVLWADAGKYIG